MTIGVAAGLLVLLVGFVLHVGELRACRAVARATPQMQHTCFAYGYWFTHRRHVQLRAIATSHPSAPVRALARRTLTLTSLSRMLLICGIVVLVAAR
jgi:hypothetical protein